MSISDRRSLSRTGRFGRRGAPPFLRANFAIPSYLQRRNWPVHRARQACTLLGYLALVIAVEAFELSVPSAPELDASLLGLTFPGVGFLNWASGTDGLLALGMFMAGLGTFGIALLLWFATGNVLAPIATWVGFAMLAAYPDLVGMSARQGDGRWPWLVGPGVIFLCILGWCRSGRPTSPANGVDARCVATAREPDTSPGELSEEDGKRLRLLLDRALQPVDRFDGFERRDQFQTAALRYQVNFMAYALAVVGRWHAPAARVCFAEAQHRLLTKIGDRRLWSYWSLENAWGNLRLGGDPVHRQNIMYSGFTALQMTLGEGYVLNLHSAGKTWRTYALDDVAGLLASQYQESSYGLLDCEPNWIYPLCNLITMAGIKAADARLGTNRWESLAGPFLAALEREGMRPDGTLVAFRSSLTGIAPPALGGIVMQAFPCLFLNVLSPDLAKRQWHLVRERLDHRSWGRLFWPIDVGNYDVSRASSYAATAAAAVEMGDREIADECLRRLETECPSREIAGVIHRERASLWAHALELIAHCNRADGLRDLAARKGEVTGPHLRSAPYPEAIVIRADPADHGVDLILDPGKPGAWPLLEFGGLLPEQHYRTGLANQPFLKTDREGRALLRFALRERTRVTLDPVG